MMIAEKEMNEWKHMEMGRRGGKQYFHDLFLLSGVLSLSEVGSRQRRHR